MLSNSPRGQFHLQLFTVKAREMPPLTVYVLVRGDKLFIQAKYSKRGMAASLEENGFEVNPRDIIVASTREDRVDRYNTTYRLSK